jgi:hypothetical protein
MIKGREKKKKKKKKRERERKRASPIMFSGDFQKRFAKFVSLKL